MSNINVENKYPKGDQERERLLALSVIGYTRGLFVISGALNGSDQYHCSLPTATGQRCLGVIDQDQIVPPDASTPAVPLLVIERGQTMLQIGAAVTAGQLLTNNAAGRAIPAGCGQPVLAIALDGGSNAGDFICATVTPPSASAPGDNTTHYVASGAIPVASGSAGLGSAAPLAMTLAQPTAAQDGTNIFISAETARAHTVMCSANGINGSKHLVTFAGQGDYVELEAMAGVWNVRGNGGTAVIS